MMNFIPRGSGSDNAGNQPGALTTGPGGRGGSGPDSPRRPPHGRGRDSADPLWVLDANNGLYLADGGTVHDFAAWNVDLYAQVAGATVAANGYAWDYSAAPDVNTSTVTGQGTYHLHFQWNDFSDPVNLTHAETITLQTTNTDQSHETQTFHFAVYEHGSNDPAWSSARPYTPPTFPLLVPPDAVQSDQETIAAQYYSLGEATGEVMTHFTLPAYHPAVAPLQLDYSSLVANPRPIFTEYYQLSLPITATSTVTATLKLNGVSQGTSTYDTHLLNDGDILAIALQGDATSLSTGRYPYEIDVTENTTVEPAQTGAVDIVNSAASLFGAGWSLDNLEHLWIQGTCSSPTGALLELPGGQSLWFAYHAGSFVTPAGDFSTLTSSGSCPANVTYTRTLKDGTQITFNSSGYQTSIFNQVENRTTAFTWNTNNNPPQLTTVTDFLGLPVTLAYDASGKLKTITDPAVVPLTSLHRKTQFGYSANHTQLTLITEPDPGYAQTIPTIGYRYDSADKLTTLTDPDGNPTTFAYSNLSGRIDTVTRADQTTESLVPQQMTGLVASGDETATLAVQAGAAYTDPRGKAWFDTLDWSGFGRGTEFFDPLGNETIIHRDNNSLPWLFEDSLDNATRSFFDNLSNPTEVVLPDGTYEQNTYTSDSLPVTLKDPRGNTTTYGYPSSPAPCLCATSKALPPVGSPPQRPTTGYGWSDGGFLQSETDPNGFTDNIRYDGAARVNALIEPPDVGGPSTNPTITFGYNTENYLTSSEDELSHVTSYTVDNLGRVLAIQLPTGGVITMTYDAAGNRTSLTDPTPLPNSQTDITQTHYDALNRVDRIIDPNGQVTTYSYDASGNLQDIYDRDTLPSGNHRDRHFIYDDAGRLTTEQWKDGSTVDYTANYSYDAASEMTSASDNYSAYSLAYDSRGRQISVDNANTPNIPHVVLTSTYDAADNRTAVMDNLSPNGSITFGYDADNRLTGLTMNVTGASDHPVATLQYDLGARLTNISRSTAASGNQVNTVLGYTQRNLVKSITDTSSTGNVTLAAYTYSYDLARNLLTKSDYDNVSQATLTFGYSYDALNQLTGVAASNAGYNESYNYTNAQNQDLNGNRSSASFGSTNQTYGAPAPDNRLTTDGQYTYTYDNEGNLLNKTGLEAGVTMSYDNTWDFRNRLIEAKKTQVSNGQVLADDHFTYDVFDQRIGKLTQGGTQQWIVYDGDNAYADFSGQTLTTRYVFANGPDELVARTNASGNSTAWYLTDNVGSVRQIVDANGNNLYRVNYFTFGEIVPGSELGTGGDRFKFAGREWDSEIRLCYNRARYYDPNNGRFIGEDPLRFFAGDTNFYRYVFNGPTVGTDPTGLAVDSVSRSLAQDPGLAAWLAGAGLPEFGGAVGKAGLGAIAAHKACSLLYNGLARDVTGKIHGDIPDYVPKNWTWDDVLDTIDELIDSIARRQQELIDLGEDASHRQRIGAEEDFLKKLLKKLEDKIGKRNLGDE